MEPSYSDENRPRHEKSHSRHKKHQPSISSYLFEILLFLTVAGLLGHTIVNFTLKYAVHEELDQMKKNLYTLKQTIYSIDHAYETLQEDLEMLVDIKEKESMLPNYCGTNVDLKQLNENVNAIRKMKNQIDQMDLTICYPKEKHEDGKEFNEKELSSVSLGQLKKKHSHRMEQPVTPRVLNVAV